ncbi:MAG: hypothetical protein RR557_06610 [Bacilli bacterium]
MKIKLEKIYLFISILLIFLNDIFTPEVILLLELIIFLLLRKSNKISIFLSIFILLISLHGLIGILVKNNEFSLFARQFIGIIGNLIFYLSVINNNNYFNAIRIYTKLSLIIAIFAIIQQVSYLFGISIIYDLRWLIADQLPPSTFYRSATIFTEASACALVLAPTMFLCLYRLIGKNKNNSILPSKFVSIIVIIGFISTFSSSGYIGIAISIVLIWMEYKHSLKQVLLLFILLILFFLAYFTVEWFKIRIDETLLIFFSNDISKNINLSSQTLFVNYKIALYNFFSTFGFGSGLGSHIVAYQKFIGNIDTSNIVLLLNQEDANSLLLRIISETGLFGIAFSTYFLVVFYSKNNSMNSIVSKMCLMYFFMRLLRYGHYFNMGMFFFIAIYIVASNKYKIHKQV